MAAVKGRPVLARGDRIRHRELGAGVVERVRRAGRALLVRFDARASLLLEVTAREVTPEVLPDAAAEVVAQADPAGAEAQAPRPAPPSVPTSPTSPTSPKRREAFRRPPAEVALEGESSAVAAQTLEALRLGVVPHADLRASSVGRDQEMALVALDLEETERAGSARVFLGDYGAGKTHLLEIVEHEALSRGYLVGRVTLDAHYARPSHPMRIYRTLVTSLAYPRGFEERGTGLEPLLRRAVEVLGSDHEEFAEHLYLAPALHYFPAVDALEEALPRDLLLDWVSGQRPEGNRELDAALRALPQSRKGRKPRVYALKDFQPWAHVYAYLLGGVAALARRVGFRGLVLLLDEAESYEMLSSSARSFADSVFRCLVLASLGPEGVRFSEAEIKKGGFPPQRRLPLVFRWPQHLYFVSAMTPSTSGEDLLRRIVPADRMTELSPLSNEDYQELSRRIVGIFEAAYPEMRMPAGLDRSLGDVLWALMDRGSIQSPREATKLTVELLDLLRLRKESLSTFFADVEQALR